MAQLFRQELTLVLETDFGNLYEASLVLTSTNQRLMPRPAFREQLVKGLSICYGKSPAKLISVGIHEDSIAAAHVQAPEKAA